MKFQVLPSLAVSLTALCLLLPGTRAARADGLISPVATVHIAVPIAESQAQLADQLRAQGFAHVVMSSTYPSPANPHPEGNASLTSHPEQTPVHAGWNGVAVKDGQTFQVYAEF
jgi:hypothetical protein